MAKKKMPFIKLAVVFFLIIIAALLFSWGYNGDNESSRMMSEMMGSSMGEMMGENHLKEITVSDLILQQDDNEDVQSEDSRSEHHNSNGSFIDIMHRITTVTICILIPFIIAGTIFLFIIWFDKQ